MAPMRVNVAASSLGQDAHRSSVLPVTVQIRPSRGVPGSHSFVTDSRRLLQLLLRDTDLSSSVLDSFETALRFSSSARLSGVDLDDRTLREVGYFID